MEVYETATWADTFVIAVFLVSAVFCLSVSAVFHASTCHSQKVSLFPTETAQDAQTIQVSAKCHTLDYVGIIG